MWCTNKVYSSCIVMGICDISLQPRRLCVRWGPRSPLPKWGGGGAIQIFGPCLLGPNGWMDEAGTSHGGRPNRVCVRRKHRSTLLQKGNRAPPQFSAHFYCGQTAACIKMWPKIGAFNSSCKSVKSVSFCRTCPGMPDQHRLA